jgi:peptidoglycan glycosyltransferase
MDSRIRWLALLLVVLFGVLFLQLNNFQVRQANSLRSKGASVEPAVDPFTLPRGEILTANGTVIASSSPTRDGYGEQRSYPLGSLFADVTGYYDVVNTADTGLEAEYNPYLAQHESSASSLGALIHQHEVTDNVVVTIPTSLQELAASELKGEVGAVVALDPRTGAILALYSNPTFNPNLLASHDPKVVNSTYARLSSEHPQPLLDHATARDYPPGSTFKIVTSAAVYDHDPSIARESFPVLPDMALPGTTDLLHNYDNEYCGGSIAEGLAVSCDTTYGRIGLQLGAQNLFDEAESFGFNSVPPIDLPSGEVAASSFPPPSSFVGRLPTLAYSAIGQENVSATALQMALVGSGIADRGVIMTPHLLEAVLSEDGSIRHRYRPHPWRRATSAATAAKVRTLMLGVTEQPDGTGYGLFPSSLQIAAKTGTAQTNGTGCANDNWFVAFGPAGPGQTPSVVVAVVVPHQASLGCGAVGATVAGPVAAKVLVAALGMGL